MSATDWAAWTGAITGVAALLWDIVSAWTERRLSVRAAHDIVVTPNFDRRFIAAYVANAGRLPVTITTLALVEYKDLWHRLRRRPGKNWVLVNNSLGPDLPVELQPGQQWMGGFPQTGFEELLDAGRLYVAVYHALSGNRPTIVRVPLRRQVRSEG
jgi:hypothetical protein